MEKLVVGYEVMVRNLDGKHKILEIRGKKVIIQFGCCMMCIKAEDIIKLYAKKEIFSRPNYYSKKYDDFLDFNTTIDLHGKNIHDSLEILEDWLEQGRKLGHRYFRIIHGKGNGILREHIKKFLYKKKLNNFCYESDCGGSTIIEL